MRNIALKSVLSVFSVVQKPAYPNTAKIKVTTRVSNARVSRREAPGRDFLAWKNDNTHNSANKECQALQVACREFVVRFQSW